MRVIMTRACPAPPQAKLPGPLVPAVSGAMRGGGLMPAVASLLGGLAQDDVWLIITRGFQGAGGAIVSPTAPSLIAANFPEGGPRERAMGVYAAMSGAGGAVGLLLGGILTDLVSWRWIFLVNVPVGALVLILAPRALNESEPTAGRLDVPGAVTATAGMLALVYGLSSAASHSWASTGTFAPLAAGVLLLAVFVLTETRSPQPLMPLSIFADRNRAGTYAMTLCILTGMYAMFYFLTQFLQNILGWSPIRTGAGFLPMSAGIAGSAVLISQLVKKTGIRLPLLAGPAIAVGGLAWLTQLTPSSGWMLVKDPETAQLAAFVPLFPFIFASSVFVPVQNMPGWLQAFARNQPVSVTVYAVRSLSEGGPIAHYTWQSGAWIVGFVAVFGWLAVRAYRRL